MKINFIKYTTLTALFSSLFLSSCDSGGGDNGSSNLNTGDQVVTTLEGNLGTINLNIISEDSLTYAYDGGEGINISGTVPFTYSNGETPEIISIINSDLNQTVGDLNTKLSEEGSLVASFYADNDTGNGASFWGDSLRWEFVGIVNAENPNSHMVLLDSRFYLITDTSFSGEGNDAIMNIKGVRVSPFRTSQGVFSFLLFNEQAIDRDYIVDVTYQN